MKILAIETSCDETSASIVKNGTEVLSNIIATQIDFHKKYGGIVPEIAARKHVEVINPIIQQALDKAKCKFKDLDAVAVTNGPGLIGCLIVGISAAKALAFSLDIPLIGINHLEGHIYANFIKVPRYQGIKGSRALKPRNLETLMPFICLLVSGGNTMIIKVTGHGKYKVLGQTRDDAVGECYDKVARFLGLGYPGGPIIDKLAKLGNPKAINFPRSMQDEKYGFDFSFSGLKTSVINHVKKSQVTSHKFQVNDICASFQQAAVDILVEKTIRAAKKHKIKRIALGGGVAANSQLRGQLQKQGQEEKIQIFIPPFEFCTDNAAMIGCAGYFNFKRKLKSDFKLRAIANLKF